MVRVIGRVEREMIMVQYQALQQKLRQSNLSLEDKLKTKREIERFVNLHRDDVKF